MEEIVHQLAGAVISTKVFLKLHLTKKEIFLTTFNTHISCMGYLQMPFRTKMNWDLPVIDGLDVGTVYMSNKNS